MTALFYVADTAAAALLSTGLRTGYAPGLWTTGNNEDVAARRFIPPCGGTGQKTRSVRSAAAAALTAFARYTGLNTDGEPAEIVIVDFLTDLMHLCSETGMPLCEMLLTASRHWQDEQDA